MRTAAALVSLGLGAPAAPPPPAGGALGLAVARLAAGSGAALSRASALSCAAWGSLEAGAYGPHGRLAALHVRRGASAAAARADALLAPHVARAAQVPPHRLLLALVLLLLVLRRLALTLAVVREDVARLGAFQYVLELLKALPGVRQVVRREQEKHFRKIEDETRRKHLPDDPKGPALVGLPAKGRSAREMRALLKARAGDDARWDEGASHMSGTVYMVGKEHLGLLDDAYRAYTFSNPLHGDTFPSVQRMEAEVAAMSASLMGGPDEAGPGACPTVCGAMTNGGTESILSAVKATRDWMRHERGIRAPEMIIGVSAHAAFIKASEYFKIKLVRVPVGRDGRLTARAVRPYVTANTVLVVGSAPGFPHGVVDDIEGLSRLAVRGRFGLHVDCCLGGFVLPFVRRLGYPVPPFDFAVPGVTSMSLDTHKFAMGHKGTSVVLYRNREIRRHQYTAVTDWTGGLYISSGMAGSRSGAVMATAWAALVHQGWDGYLRATERMMQATQILIKGVEATEGLEVVGDPAMSVVAWQASPGPKPLCMYRLFDLLSQRGWHLNALQHPPSIHMCLTAAHSAELVERLVQDLRECAEALRADPNLNLKGGKAPMYGMAASLPDRATVGDVLAVFQDSLLAP